VTARRCAGAAQRTVEVPEEPSGTPDTKEQQAMNTTTTTSPSRSRGRTALSVITAGIAGAAVLVGMALAIDAVSGSSHAPMSGVTTSAPAMPPGALVYSAD
jgi:short subunit dehydrogenase-like uncharacterized protein